MEVWTCGGGAWRVEIVAHDLRARRAVDGLRSCGPEGVWVACDGGWRFTGPREVATLDDPLIDVAVRVEGDPSVVAALGSSTLRVRPARSAPGGALRIATADEAAEGALRWVLGWGHFGCRSPADASFWAPRTEGRAYALEDVGAWISAGVPLPTDGIEGRLGISVACHLGLMSIRQAQAIAEALGATSPHADADVGIFTPDEPRAQACVIVASLSDDAGGAASSPTTTGARR